MACQPPECRPSFSTSPSPRRTRTGTSRSIPIDLPSQHLEPQLHRVPHRREPRRGASRRERRCRLQQRLARVHTVDRRPRGLHPRVHITAAVDDAELRRATQRGCDHRVLPIADVLRDARRLRQRAEHLRRHRLDRTDRCRREQRRIGRDLIPDRDVLRGGGQSRKRADLQRKYVDADPGRGSRRLPSCHLVHQLELLHHAGQTRLLRALQRVVVGTGESRLVRELLRAAFGVVHYGLLVHRHVGRRRGVQLQRNVLGFDGRLRGDESGLVGVSCESATFCMAVDYDEAWIYDGNSWSAAHELIGEQAQSVSCTAPSFCVVIDDFPNYYDAGTWTTTPPIAQQAGAMCVLSSTFCMATADTQAVRYDEGIMRPRRRSIRPRGGRLLDVSCASQNFCVTGRDAPPLSLIYDGSRWHARQARAAAYLAAIDCVSGPFASLPTKATSSSTTARNGLRAHPSVPGRSPRMSPAPR